MSNGNGLQFDISDDQQFKLYVVQKLQHLTDRWAEFDRLKAEVDDRKKWDNIGHAMGPVMVILHGIAHKLGIPV